MGYSEQTWQDGNPAFPASATRFAVMEAGIAAAYPDLVFNVMAEGAAGDWNGSTGTDDTAAINAAIAKANAAGRGYVLIPNRHRITSALTATAASVTIGGIHGGNWASEIALTADIPINTFAITIGGGSSSRGGVSDLRVTGPGTTATTGAGNVGVLGGTTATTAGGVGIAGNKALIQRVRVAGGFAYGISWVGNHQHFLDVDVTGCGYNVYGIGGGSTFGDQTFRDCDFTGTRVASIAVAGNNTLDAVTLDNVHCGFGPYGLYGETKISKDLLTNSSLSDLAFESIGNAAIYDATPGKTRVLSNLTWIGGIGGGGGWDATRSISGNSTNYTFDVGSFINCDFNPGNWDVLISGATLGLLSGTVSNVNLRNTASLIVSLLTSGKTVLNASSTLNGCYLWGVYGELMRLCKWGGGIAAVTGDLATFGASLGPFGVTRSTSQVPFGVVAHPAPNNTYVPVVISGRVFANSGANTIAAGVNVKQGGTAGQIAAATTPVPAAGDHPIVGVSVAANGATSAGFTEMIVMRGG